MQGEPGIDFPETKAAIDVIRGGDVGMSWVEELTGNEIVVTVGQTSKQQPIRVEPGERLELIWSGPGELRALPVQVVAVDKSGTPVWRLRAAGAASRGQRRAAVRAPMQVGVRVTKGGVSLDGTTVDLSEGGLRCVLEPAAQQPGPGGTDAATEPAAGPAPATPPGPAAATPSREERELLVGDVIQVAVAGRDDPIEAKAEVVRRHKRQDPRSEVSVRFIGLSEYQQDAIRRRVFAHLRDLRQRGLA